ncbi:fluoride efflux transporter CrcB [Candidatus Marinamargulisbacteria bacterium SCGC AG-410-N11]|nr:fluoride efflux transporter CrcB [Candidatus Marinamargulisbacteria bacterium SCGC AG-410-N11]
MHYFWLVMIIGFAGFLGTLLRFGISEGIITVSKGVFPWGTLFVNIAGCFIIGLVWHWMSLSTISSHWKYSILYGVLGAFTTFSTFALDGIRLMQDGHIKLAIIYFLVSNIGGFLFVFLGYQLFGYCRYLKGSFF